METKAETLILDNSASEEESPPISNSIMKIKSEIGSCSNSIIETKIKIKQEGPLLDVGFPQDFALDTMRMRSSIGDSVFSKVEVKEEPLWQEKSLKVKYQPEASCNMLHNVKDEANGDVSAVESTRLAAETTASTYSVTPCLFITSSLKEKEGLKGEKDYLRFAEVKYVHEANGNSTTETSCRGGTVQYHNLKISTQSETHNKCDTGTKNLHVCEICKKCFSHQNALKAHILFHEGKRRYKCYVCEKSYTRSGHLKAHSLIHEGKRPYKCGVCEKSYTRSGHLKTHSLIHEGKRPYRCDACEKGFTKMEDLKRHILIHEGKKPYKCEVCDKSFTQSGHLKTHSLTHEGKRPYRCEVCGKSYTRSGHLKTHSLIHEGKRPYNCDVCKKGFSKMRYLERHILIHESEGRTR